MAKQIELFSDLNDDNKISLGNGLFIEIKTKYPYTAYLYRYDTLIKQAQLGDRIAKRLFIVEAVEFGAMKSRLASVMEISRQTIDNYLGTKKHFGLEGLVHGYSPSVSKSLHKQRELKVGQGGIPGNKARQLEEIRKKEKEERAENHSVSEY